jgi:hypothetical protein
MKRKQPEITSALAQKLERYVKWPAAGAFSAEVIRNHVRDQVDYFTGSEIAGWRLDKLTDWVIEVHEKKETPGEKESCR